jgi:hypothetical protein
MLNDALKISKNFFMEVQVQSGDKIHATKYLGLVSEILRFAQDDKHEMMG